MGKMCTNQKLLVWIEPATTNDVICKTYIVWQRRENLNIYIQYKIIFQKTLYSEVFDTLRKLNMIHENWKRYTKNQR